MESALCLQQLLIFNIGLLIYICETSNWNIGIFLRKKIVKTVYKELLRIPALSRIRTVVP